MVEKRTKCEECGADNDSVGYRDMIGAYVCDKCYEYDEECEDTYYGKTEA